MRNSRWTPLPNVTHHCGDPLPNNLDFFIPPPTQIGKVLSAQTNIKLTQQQPSPIFNCTVLAIATVLVAILGDVLVCITGGGGVPTARLTISILCALLVVFVGFSCYPIFPYCSYVGEDGIAEFKQYSSIEKTKRFVLQFQDTTKLFHQQVNTFYNGIYSGTSYEYKWHNQQQSIRSFYGYHYALNKPPKANSSWHFLNCAESAWTYHSWQNAEKYFQRFGYVEFDVSQALVGKIRGVRVGKGWVEFMLKNDRLEKFYLAEMKQTSLIDGMFQFTHQNAKWFSADGKFCFNYSALANARLFLVCMERIASKDFVAK